MSRDIRQKALQKIAALSASNTTTSFDKSDLDRLCKACHSHSKVKESTNGYASRQPQLVARVPMVRTSFRD